MVNSIRDLTPTFVTDSKKAPVVYTNNTINMRSLFSNNAAVYYKPGSNSVGAGGVRNMRAKMRKT